MDMNGRSEEFKNPVTFNF